MNDILLQAKSLRKQFGQNIVLKDVDLSIRRGEVHALVGENGAGKSTLIKILGGVHRADGGNVYLNGNELSLRSPQAAIAEGIVVIHQELSLAPHLTCGENIFLGHFPRNAIGMLDRHTIRNRTKELLDRLKIDIDPGLPVGQLSIAQQQMIEIAKAISLDAKLLVLDEPTAVLDANHVDTLFDLIKRLSAEGIGILFISHHLEEIFRIADNVTVLRDGERTGVGEVAQVDQGWLISKMIGRELEAQQIKERNIGAIALEVENLTSKDVFENISFVIREGEIVGLAGLVGAGRTEVAQAIFGLRPYNSGRIKVFNKLKNFSGPRAATQSGIAYVSEDRKAFGLLQNRPVRENTTISNLARFRLFGFLRLGHERAYVDRQIKDLDIRLSSMQTEISSLSGGNQQKVLLARALAGSPRILIFDEPTRGVDIGAKREIYSFIEKLAEEGVAILVISSEMNEILKLSDRVLVMRSGRLNAELSRIDASEETIMLAASVDESQGTI